MFRSLPFIFLLFVSGALVVFIFSSFLCDTPPFFTLSLINLSGRGREACGTVSPSPSLNSGLSGFWDWNKLGRITRDQICTIQCGVNSVAPNQTGSSESLPIIYKVHTVDQLNLFWSLITTCSLRVFVWQESMHSYVLKGLISLSTAVLLGLIVMYHAREIQVCGRSGTSSEGLQHLTNYNHA